MSYCVHSPSLSRKVPRPDSAEIPAPVRMTSERKRLPVTTSSAVGNGTADGGHLLVLGPGRRFVGHPVHAVVGQAAIEAVDRSEEHTSELQSLMRISYAVFCLTKK